MPSSFFFMLGLFVGTAIAKKDGTDRNTSITSTTTSITNTTTFITNTTTFITHTSTMSATIDYDRTTIKTSNSRTEMNVSTKSSTDKPSGNSTISVATRGRAKPSSQTVTETKRTTKPQTTPAPGGSVTSQTTKGTFPKSSTSSPKTAGSDKTGIIILVILILVVVAFLLACYVTQKRRRRYSVDFSSRQDEVNIPLSTVEPVDTAPQNGSSI
ncbi:salivary glue protein Sgs-3 [Neolamprologus brichardi]|uniref:salivary glue protein Sgs-3 n=1 Tax=Neolamprologus brichardi TaxID=32507 RepID=UPI001643B5BF|nr:salivary glue protein Sgs-3 [Neolamprologus brichardi]